MTSGPDPTPGNDLQFDRAEYEAGASAAAPGAVCSVCQQPIASEYFTVNQNVVCPNCLRQLHASMTGGSGTWRLLSAIAWGIAAGFLGAVIWFAVRKMTGYEVGLIAIVVGLMVGAAVRRGSQGRGGLVYQLLAVVLTYSSIVSNYIPDVFMALRDELKNGDAVVATTQPATTQPVEDGAATATATRPSTGPAMAAEATPGADEYEDGAEKPGAPMLVVYAVLFVVLLFALAFVAPILAGFQNIIGLLIIGFALWEAWKINKRPHFDTAGPFAIGGAGPGGVGTLPPAPGNVT
jgi:hypothetical protein